MTEQGTTRKGRPPLSPEQRERAAANLAKARAARAAGSGGGAQPWQRDILPIVSGMSGQDAAYLCAGYFLAGSHGKQRGGGGGATAQGGTQATG